MSYLENTESKGHWAGPTVAWAALSAMALTVLGSHAALAAGKPAKETAARDKIAILDAQTTSVSPQLAPLLTDVVAAEVDALKRFEVVTGAELTRALGLKKQADLVGCTDAECLVDIGGAVGARYILATHVGKMGTTYVVHAKLIDIANARTERRVYETIVGGEEVLLNTLRVSIRKIFDTSADAATSSAAGESRGAGAGESAPSGDALAAGGTGVGVADGLDGGLVIQQTSSERRGEMGSLIAIPLALTAGGAVAIVVGGVFGYLTLRHSNDAGSADDPSQTGRQIDLYEASQNKHRANISYAVGISAAVLGVGSYFFIDWMVSRQGGGVAIVPTVSANGVAGLAAAGHF